MHEKTPFAGDPNSKTGEFAGAEGRVGVERLLHEQRCNISCHYASR